MLGGADSIGALADLVVLFDFLCLGRLLVVFVPCCTCRLICAGLFDFWWARESCGRLTQLSLVFYLRFGLFGFDVLCV